MALPPTLIRVISSTLIRPASSSCSVWLYWTGDIAKRLGADKTMGNAERRRDVVAKDQHVDFTPRLLHFSALFQEVGRKSGAREMMYCEPSCTETFARCATPARTISRRAANGKNEASSRTTNRCSQSQRAAACSTRWRWPSVNGFAFMTIAPISLPGRAHRAANGSSA
ncbi:Uncharacterised protein [Raoultella ornithinolytica]|nr:Uncharacterised protein [Raoultella ornithinolytica]